MDEELFKAMIINQQAWRKKYQQNEQTKKIIRSICNRKYKSNLEELKESLKDYPEMILQENTVGEFYFQTVSEK